MIPQLYLFDVSNIGGRTDDVTLTVDEMSRYTKIVCPEKRGSRILARKALKVLLAEELGVDTQDLKFDEAPFQKPRLVNDPLHFSLSHSNNMIAIGTSRFGPIGIDIESVKDRPLDSLSRNSLSAFELFEFGRMNDNIERLNYVLRKWTGKEAYLKGVGIGLGVDMKTFDLASVTFERRSDAPVLSIGPSSHWYLQYHRLRSHLVAICWRPSTYQKN